MDESTSGPELKPVPSSRKLTLNTLSLEAANQHQHQLKSALLIPSRPPSSSSTSSTTFASTAKVTLSDGLRACHFNDNSLTGHIEMVRVFLSTRPLFDVIAITKTWLDDKIKYIPLLDNYSLYRHDRNSNGGGVALYIHYSLTATIISSSDDTWSGKPGGHAHLCRRRLSSTPCFFYRRL
ncbi:hypothetical protein TSAR_006776 [Trichomalopsis sarcophagae]|uniref:Uncharacterized protein n=1 Tax=Trichomalopsis sarcophagae TaxID=543379 RepID=A0A232FMU8_9HYME|nr:hypothetical protein TSAR_006776 [Trichomalopsis sarcophagae]